MSAQEPVGPWMGEQKPTQGFPMSRHSAREYTWLQEMREHTACLQLTDASSDVGGEGEEVSFALPGSQSEMDLLLSCA